MKTRLFFSFLVLLLLLAAIGCNGPEQAPDSQTPTGSQPPSDSTPTSEITVTRVIDGDTIEVDIGGVLYRVRYIGIDTPELDDERPEFCVLAQEATRYNRQLVEGQEIRLEKDVSEADHYGRLLRYVYVGDVFVNLELVSTGLAWSEAHPPDTKYQAVLDEAESEAMLAKIGIWQEEGEPPPIFVENVQITDIFYDGLVPNVESDEYVEITNLSDQPQDLEGCVLIDVSDGHPSFIFPSYILAPGESVRVYTNEYHPEWGGFSFESPTAVWNNSEPDTAELRDNQGNILSQMSY
jgi:endonuclease YncB( thermonuclease family)